jgi:hypothetical protein
MFPSRLGRIVASGVLAGATFLTFTGPANATVTGIKCRRMTGNISSTVTLKRCTGNTGTASKPLPAASLASGGTITWKNGKTTTVSLTVTQGSAANCAAGDSEYNATGTVTKDTTKSVKIGGKVKASVCVAPTGAISLVPGTRATFA